MYEEVPTEKIVIAGLVLLFVTLAIGQIVIFDLNKDTKKNLLLHKVIACLGMGAAFYAISFARRNFSFFEWVCLVGAVVAIIAVGSAIHLSKPKRARRSKKKTPRPKTKSKPMEIPDWIFECTGGVLVLFWGLVLFSPVLWYFLGDERPYLEVARSYWDSFARWYTKS